MCRSPQPGAVQDPEYAVDEAAVVLLRMTQAGICGSDLHTWRGDQTQDAPAAAADGPRDGTRRHRRD